MFKVGDKVKATEACAYIIEADLKVGAIGTVVWVDRDFCKFRFTVRFEGDLYDRPCSEEELEFA